MWDKATFREMLGFSVWNFIGCTAGLLKDQGVNILINLFFSTVVNAARGVAMQINSIVNQFTTNFTMAINPQITKYYASGDLPRMHRLVFYGTRMSYYLFMFIAIPVFFEIDAVLLVWLGQVPEHTVLFVRLILILTLTEILSRMLITAQNATGRIRNYQLVVGGLLLLNFPLSYVALKLGYAPESTVVVGIIVSLICLVARLCFLRTSVSLRVRDYVHQVLVNTLLVTLFSSVVPAMCYYFIEHYIIRFFAVCVSSVVMSAIVIYFVGCNSWERDMLRGYVAKFMNKILHR
jgi:O-antigen/teichoic acid export membrane protein